MAVSMGRTEVTAEHWTLIVRAPNEWVRGRNRTIDTDRCVQHATFVHNASMWPHIIFNATSQSCGKVVTENFQNLLYEYSLIHCPIAVAGEASYRHVPIVGDRHLYGMTTLHSNHLSKIARTLRRTGIAIAAKSPFIGYGVEVEKTINYSLLIS